MRLGEPSLDQLRIFLSVEEEGSFGGAARKMGRAVSAISYGVQQMETQLGVTLFAREGSRKPVLTDAGQGLLAEARAIIDASDALLAKTQSLHAGLESEVSLVLDVMIPGAVIARVLQLAADSEAEETDSDVSGDPGGIYVLPMEAAAQIYRDVRGPEAL
jgi:DNA-binding transcriptional LysR family regulator